MTLSGLFEGVCRVFNPGMIKMTDPIPNLNKIIPIKDEDYNYIKTTIGGVQFYINRSSMKCIYVPFNIRGNLTIFINIPDYDKDQCIDITYYNINQHAHEMFFQLVTGFFPNELFNVRDLYAWMAAFKLSERMCNNVIGNYSRDIQKIAYSHMMYDLKPIVSENLSITKFSDTSSETTVDYWLELVSKSNEELFNNYGFLDIINEDSIEFINDPSYVHRCSK